MCSSSGMSRLRLRDGKASKSRLQGQSDKAFILLNHARLALVPSGGEPGLVCPTVGTCGDSAATGIRNQTGRTSVQNARMNPASSRRSSILQIWPPLGRPAAKRERQRGNGYREVAAACPGVPWRALRDSNSRSPKLQTAGPAPKQKSRAEALLKTKRFPSDRILFAMFDRESSDLKRLWGRSSHDLDRVAPRVGLPCAFRDCGQYWISRRFATRISNCGHRIFDPPR
jgi:hypothetical protein